MDKNQTQESMTLQSALDTLIAKGKKDGTVSSKAVIDMLDAIDATPEQAEQIYNALESAESRSMWAIFWICCRTAILRNRNLLKVRFKRLKRKKWRIPAFWQTAGTGRSGPHVSQGNRQSTAPLS